MNEDDHFDLWHRELRQQLGLSMQHHVNGLQFGWRRLTQKEPQMRKRKKGDLRLRRRDEA